MRDPYLSTATAAGRPATSAWLGTAETIGGGIGTCRWPTGRFLAVRWCGYQRPIPAHYPAMRRSLRNLPSPTRRRRCGGSSRSPSRQAARGAGNAAPTKPFAVTAAVGVHNGHDPFPQGIDAFGTPRRGDCDRPLVAQAAPR